MDLETIFYYSDEGCKLKGKGMIKKKLPLDVSTFETLIKGNYLYIDKTRDIYNFITSGRLHFLARPPGFGKSLLVSTLKELFSGNRELFKGLWIDSSDYSWEKYYVIVLNLSTIDSSSPENFLNDLALVIHNKAQDFGYDVSISQAPGRKLTMLVEHLSKKRKVVILIDEYDYPLINNLHNAAVRDGNLEVLKNFFTLIKGLDEHLRALFITGVLPLPKASIFSGFNNADTLSLDPQVATLLGYTKEEVITYFSEYIHELAACESSSEEEILTKIQTWYNGYRFSKVEAKIYNPFSLHCLFNDNKFANYWSQSATPSFLLEVIQRNKYELENNEGVEASADALNNLNLQDPQLIPLLFQTGYLTITSYDERRDIYTLNYPNQEVRLSYGTLLLAAITHSNEIAVKSLSFRMEEALLNYKMELMCQVLNTAFARVPYHIDKREESYYHSLLSMFIGSLSIYSSQAEVITNKGRIDMVVNTGKFLYIFEVKVDSSPEKALKQIKDRHYYERYLEGKEDIVLVGLAFNKKDGEMTVSCTYEEVIKNR